MSRKSVGLPYVSQFPTSASIKLLSEENYSKDTLFSVKANGDIPSWYTISPYVPSVEPTPQKAKPKYFQK